MPFSSLGLSPELIRAVAGLGFSAPTPIQSRAIPAAIAGSDLLAVAQTGSGKTVAFALPVLQGLAGKQYAPRPTQALVLVPTRELAVQVTEVLRGLSQYLPRPPKIAALFGGVSVNPQMMGLRGGADIVVATPGRLLDLVAHHALTLSAVRMLVLDEADRLLDLGFSEELGRILALLPPRRQSLFFSATFAPEVAALASTLLHDPLRLELAPSLAGGADIVQRAIRVDASRRTELLRHLLKQEGWDRVLVFVATQYAAQHVAWKLYKAGLFATPFHGALSQGARKQVLEEFGNGQWDIVVTTDLAARGIDIDRLPVVLNYDLPRSAVDYVHRIGRTGRAAQPGLAVSFVSAQTEAHFRLIEKRQRLNLAREEIAGFEAVDSATVVDLAPVPGTGGVKGKRPSKKDKLRASVARAAPDT